MIQLSILVLKQSERQGDPFHTACRFKMYYKALLTDCLFTQAPGPQLSIPPQRLNRV